MDELTRERFWPVAVKVVVRDPIEVIMERRRILLNLPAEKPIDQRDPDAYAARARRMKRDARLVRAIRRAS